MVFHDLLGMMSNQDVKMKLSFCKKYANLGEIIQKSLIEFKKEVEEKQFPDMTYSPYKINTNELNELHKLLKEKGYDKLVEENSIINTK